MDSPKKTNAEIVLKQCPNCNYPSLTEDIRFCPSCGQDCKEKRITVWSLFQEAFSNIFNLDNKLWQTTLNLFFPGKLTNEFFLGRRQRYVSPLRIFLITALAFFATIQMFTLDDTDTFLDAVSENHKKNAFYGVFLNQLDLETDTLLQNPAQFPNASPVIDSLRKRMRHSYSDSTTIGFINLFSQSDSISNLTVSRKDLVEMTQDSLVKHYGNGNFWDDLILRKNLRLAEKGENFLSYLMGQLVWMMLIMMPFLALFLKLIYIRRNFYYVDHLIFSFHTHAFVFLIFSILLLLNNYLPNNVSVTDINVIGILGVGVYFYIALRKVYGQSKLKTFIKLILINVFYAVLFLIAVLMTSIIAALFF